jgi:hypothetical protein
MNKENEKRLNRLKNLFKKIEKDLNTSIYKEGDARYDILNYLLKEINNYGIAEGAVWDYIVNIDNIDKEKVFNEFVNSYKDKFLIITCSFFEIFIRQIAYKKYPEISKFTKISKIVNEKMNFTNDESKELWKIYSRIRNSMHNMKYIFLDKSPTLYKNKAYSFKEGEHIEGFVDFYNVLYLFEEIYDNIVMDLIDKSKEIEFVESVF